MAGGVPSFSASSRISFISTCPNQSRRRTSPPARKAGTCSRAAGESPFFSWIPS